MQDDDVSSWLWDVQQRRRTVLPKRLTGPGPSEAERLQLLQAACQAPDHERLRPWRLLEISAGQRAALGQVFVDALCERDPGADAAQCAQAREKAERAPLLWLLTVSDAVQGVGADAKSAPTDPSTPHTDKAEVPWSERLISAGCAVQNILLMATALGYGSSLTSGKALQSQALRQWLQLAPEQQAICFISIGTVASLPAKKGTPRPDPADICTVV